jgi:hypothetical protein
MLYEDWLNSEGDWSRSSIHYNSLEKSKYKRKGKYIYMAYKDVEEKYGTALAKTIKKTKLELEAARGEDEDAWYCKHPEIKDEEFRFCFGFFSNLSAGLRLLTTPHKLT